MLGDVGGWVPEDAGAEVESGVVEVLGLRADDDAAGANELGGTTVDEDVAAAADELDGMITTGRR